MVEADAKYKGILENATVGGKDCYNVDALFGDTITNMSADDAKALTCAKAIIWAKKYGIKYHKSYYKNFTDDGLTEDSPYADFQCALNVMKGSDEAGKGWDCDYPCTSSLPQCPPPTNATTDKGVPEIETTTAASSSSSSSLPLFAWILIGLALLGIIGGLAYYFMTQKKEAPKKKKRAVKKTATPAPAPEPKVEEPAPVPVLTAPPVYVTQAVQAAPVMIAQAMPAMPTYSMATPTYITEAAPAYSSSVVYPGSASVPVATMAAPIATMAAAMPAYSLT